MKRGVERREKVGEGDEDEGRNHAFGRGRFAEEEEKGEADAVRA